MTKSRNGYHEPREVITAAGAIEVHAPRVNDKQTEPESAERQRFSSASLPRWARKTPQAEQALPLLYLHGFVQPGFQADAWAVFRLDQGVSVATITKLTETWQTEQKAFSARDPWPWIMCTSGSMVSTPM